jgi:hypothetical protein
MNFSRTKQRGYNIMIIIAFKPNFNCEYSIPKLYLYDNIETTLPNLQA